MYLVGTEYMLVAFAPLELHTFAGSVIGSVLSSDTAGDWRKLTPGGRGRLFHLE